MKNSQKAELHQDASGQLKEQEHHPGGGREAPLGVQEGGKRVPLGGQEELPGVGGAHQGESPTGLPQVRLLASGWRGTWGHTCSVQQQVQQPLRQQPLRQQLELQLLVQELAVQRQQEQQQQMRAQAPFPLLSREPPFPSAPFLPSPFPFAPA